MLVAPKPSEVQEWPRAKPPAGGPFPPKINKSGFVTKILKAPAASAGFADSRTGLIYFITSPEGNCRGGSAHFEMPPPAGGLA